MRFAPLRIAVLVLALLLAPAAVADDESPPKLLGAVAFAALEQEPHVEWYAANRTSYVPDPDVTVAVRSLLGDDVTVDVFFGTWCGDSRREVPRFVRVTEQAGVSPDRIRLIAVDNAPDAIKRSPGGEEAGLEIYRVPTFVVRRGGEEIGRIEEHPVRSLERDLASILAREPYRSAYPAYPMIRRWLSAGLLSDPNVSPSGLAGLLREHVQGEGDLAAAASVLISRGDVPEGVRLREVNVALHRDSARAAGALARGYVRLGRMDDARRLVERALRLNDDPDLVGEILAILEPEADGRE